MPDDENARRRRQFEDELIGLDPDDPEAQEFADHLHKMQRAEPTFTVESSLRGVAEFAEGSTRASGLRWWTAVLIVVLILLGVIVAAWDQLSAFIAHVSQ
ncbi:hypothetical protein [Prauserella rugosa]|uniref:Uncharacterized protein n=1 Tax=Prauserella rugosa TaxID=43354 RepID=A0A660CBF8_9PSEU|nr:hypothetical protein [Prauserella rugosa]KID31283.1 hypothetical protein HQ32_01101 [Prauserella sp. Am3]KMS87552.1 hypothetical protein ACZ91_30770 [Streptomyces regensis]TWH19093.1 hypothetical protein JD82_00915 [Prauserella rugosa]